MTDAELYTIWGWSLGLAGLVVIIAAALLIAILIAARSILRHAREAEEAVKRIAERTHPILTLDETSKLTEDTLDVTEQLEAQTERIADALQRESQEVRR
jgi:flagellar biosynthesis/type III secretory pathway M-ring protein FliF/YscJ